uniref:dual-specificity kinase n=1 Tax=Rodentolepis nana TaxID=102285 RepID=A0A0R3TBB3_RODNA
LYLGSDAHSTASGSGLSSRNHSHNPGIIRGHHRSSEGSFQNSSSGFYQISSSKPHRSHKRHHHSKHEKVVLVTSADRNNNQGSPRSKLGRKFPKKNIEIQFHHHKTETKAPVNQGLLTTTTITSNSTTVHKSSNYRSKHQHSKVRSWLTPEGQSLAIIVVPSKFPPPNYVAFITLILFPIPETIRLYGSSLTDYERTEILDYKKIYYFGLGATKSTGRNESYNSGYDSRKGEYRTVEHDHIAYRYEVLESIGQGAFGEVVTAYDHKKHRKVALKIIRNRPNLHEQARIEVKALKALEKHDPHGKNFTLRIFDSFTFRNHPCIVCELIGENLYEVLRRGNFEGLPMKTIRSVAKCVLKCLAILSEESMIHCDVKPENILLVPGDKAHVKLIDFGSSCRESEQLYNYIQSRYYRAPEVLMGMRYTASIDMWSLGCVLAELYTGNSMALQLLFYISILLQPYSFSHLPYPPPCPQHFLSFYEHNAICLLS